MSSLNVFYSKLLWAKTLFNKYVKQWRNKSLAADIKNLSHPDFMVLVAFSTQH